MYKLAAVAVLCCACTTDVPRAMTPDAPSSLPPDGPPAAVDAAPPSGDPRVAWYQDGMTTGTGSTNDFAAIRVDANTISIAQLARLIETSKYSGQPRPFTAVVDFDEVFLSRATNSTFMTKLAAATTRVLAAGWPKVIVYCNGFLSMAQATTYGWAHIASSGVMVGLEAYTTTFMTYVKDDLTAYPFHDAATVQASITANPDLYAAFKSRLLVYVQTSKAQLGDPMLYSHLTLVEFENSSHDITALQNLGYTAAKATHIAALWYAALEAVAASEGIHYGVYHPA
jgi:hypothetical protein